MSKYNLSGPAIEVIEKAHSLNKQLPFLHGPDKPWEQLGDDVLAEVAAAVIYSESQPMLLVPPPYHGFSEDVVSIAVTLVSPINDSKVSSPKPFQIFAAISEWTSGYYQPKAQELSYGPWLAISNQFKETLHEFRTTHPSRWLKFSKNVFSKAKANLEFSNPFDAPHVLPSTSLLPLDLTYIPANRIPLLQSQQPDFFNTYVDGDDI
jgi:hypothetical protein